MNKTGIYRGGKVYYRWTGTKSFGGDLEKYDVINVLDWWPSSNQEVDFEIISGKAMIRRLGKIYDQETADILCSGNYK